MKVFLDTNIWLRLLLADEEATYQKCRQLFDKIEAGQIKPYTSTIVLLEISFVLSKIYKITKTQVINDLETILTTRNLTLIEKTDFKKALNFYKKYQIKLADCLIASQITKDIALCSFDKDFKKISGFKIVVP